MPNGLKSTEKGFYLAFIISEYKKLIHCKRDMVQPKNLIQSNDIAPQRSDHVVELD